MDASKLIRQLEIDAKRFQALVAEVSDEQARWRPDEQAWSMLEMVCHLHDEERLDFRVRIDTLLHHPGEEAPPIDPEGWVHEHRYNERDLQTELDGFMAERQKSITWLKSLEAPDWEATYQAPWGSIRAGDIFAGWLAHDLLHMRQLLEHHWAYLNRECTPYSTQYGGEW
jgi:DinB superfamily